MTLLCTSRIHLDQDSRAYIILTCQVGFCKVVLRFPVLGAAATVATLRTNGTGTGGWPSTTSLEAGVWARHRMGTDAPAR